MERAERTPGNYSKQKNKTAKLTVRITTQVGQSEVIRWNRVTVQPTRDG